MRINWLQDYDIFSFQGGAEMNDAAHFAAGLRRGHELRLIGPTHPFFTADAQIISNCVQFDHERLKNMVNSVPTVFFFHDYIFCKYRLFYPMIEHCGTCEYAKWWLDLFMKAKLLIWLSPLHREATLVAFPDLKNREFALIPSAINPDKFINNKEITRQDAYLSVNSLAPFKGRDNLITYASLHPEMLFHIVSQDQEPDLPGNMLILPPQTYDGMPKIYRMYKNYIELPSTPQPFNRTVVEAKLSGCKVITNKLMGAVSWPWFQEGPEHIAAMLRCAPDNFWTAVERSVK